MNVASEYWPVLVGAIAITAVIYDWLKAPRSEQIEKVKEVLIYWVIQAEKELGGGTGLVKLRFVYDLFVSRFPALSKFIAFEVFSDWVDEALEVMRVMIEENESLEKYIK